LANDTPIFAESRFLLKKSSRHAKSYSYWGTGYPEFSKVLTRDIANFTS
jgi:hypothetical protein